MGGISPLIPSSSSAGVPIGPYLSYALAAGANNNVDPSATWPVTAGGLNYGRLDLDTSAGVATLTGLKAGNDGQEVLGRVIGANQLTVDTFNAGSTAANQFSYAAGGFILVQWSTFLLVYYAGSVNKWVLR